MKYSNWDSIQKIKQRKTRKTGAQRRHNENTNLSWIFTVVFAKSPSLLLTLTVRQKTPWKFLFLSFCRVFTRRHQKCTFRVMTHAVLYTSVRFVQKKDLRGTKPHRGLFVCDFSIKNSNRWGKLGKTKKRIIFNYYPWIILVWIHL